MKKWVKIVFIISAALNLGWGVVQVLAYNVRKENIEYAVKMKYETRTKTVNVSLAKKTFLDSLFLKYPESKNKEFLFINFWDTGDGYSIQQLPMLDTLIEPLLPNVGYVLVNAEKPDYAARILKQDSAETKNFLFMNRCEDFMYAINQELLIPRTRFNYPHCPMNIILNKTGKIIYFDTLESWSGPRWPEDSLNDKKFVHQLNKTFSELK